MTMSAQDSVPSKDQLQEQLAGLLYSLHLELDVNRNVPEHVKGRVGRFAMRDWLNNVRNRLHKFEEAFRASNEPAVKCRANRAADPPQDCDAPFCGCNPAWDQCIQMLQECDLLIDRSVPRAEQPPSSESCAELWAELERYRQVEHVTAAEASTARLPQCHWHGPRYRIPEFHREISCESGVSDEAWHKRRLELQERIRERLGQPPATEPCTVCRRPLPPLSQWSMPACPTCTEAIETAAASQPPGPGEFKMGESVRVGPFHNGEYSKVMKITGAQYYCDYTFGPYSADLIVRATSTKRAECQHDKTKPNPTLEPMHSVNDGYKWRCTVCDDRITLPVPSALGERSDV